MLVSPVSWRGASIASTKVSMLVVGGTKGRARKEKEEAEKVVCAELSSNSRAVLTVNACS